MRPLDVPEIPILVGIAGGVAWAVYNWFQRQARGPRKTQ